MYRHKLVDRPRHLCLNRCMDIPDIYLVTIVGSDNPPSLFSAKDFAESSAEGYFDGYGTSPTVDRWYYEVTIGSWVRFE
jgi:hypothetical protein